MKVCGWLVAVLRAAEALGAAQLWAGPGRGGVGSLGAALFAGFLVGPGDALQPFSATEPEMGQKRELKLKPLAAVRTRVVRRTWEEERQGFVMTKRDLLGLTLTISIFIVFCTKLSKIFQNCQVFKRNLTVDRENPIHQRRKPVLMYFQRS